MTFLVKHEKRIFLAFVKLCSDFERLDGIQKSVFVFQVSQIQKASIDIVMNACLLNLKCAESKP